MGQKSRHDGTVEQGSQEWFMLRLGKLTASKLALALGKTKGGWVASRENVMCEMAVERLTKNPTESFTSSAMQWGKDTEPLARDAYAFVKGIEVQEVPFVDHPEIEWSGASPDGLVGDDGLVEIKCPNTATHIKTITGAAIKKAYIWQMQWQMACTGRKWCDFVSYDPRMPEHLQLFIKRVDFDEALVASLEHDAKEFLGEVDRMVETLENMEMVTDG
jgi:putative phage-type endonuclease